MADFGPLGYIRNDDARDALCVAIEAGDLGVARSARFESARPSLKGFWNTLTRRGVTGIFLADAELKLGKGYSNAFSQKRGTCVGQGTARAVQDSWNNLLAFKMELGRRVEISVETIYGDSRMNPKIGNGRLAGGDGDHGSWASRSVEESGVLERKSYTLPNGQVIDLSKPREDLAVLWGDEGVPKGMYPFMAEHKVMTHNARNVDEMADATASRLGGAVCMGMVFGDRDANGMSRPARKGGHCTALAGVFLSVAGELCFLIRQSWGNTLPKGPDTLRYMGGTRKLAPGEYGVYAADVAHLLPQGESWHYEIVTGQGWR